MGEAGWGGEVGGDRVALAELAGDGGEVEAESGSGGRAGGGDSERAGGISGEEIHAVLERFGEGVELGGYLILLAEIVGLEEWIF